MTGKVSGSQVPGSPEGEKQGWPVKVWISLKSCGEGQEECSVSVFSKEPSFRYRISGGKKDQPVRLEDSKKVKCDET